MKRFISLLVIFLLLISQGACTDIENKNSSDVTDEHVKANNKIVYIQYQERFFPFPGEITVTDIAQLQGRLLILGTDDNQYYLSIADYSFDDQNRTVFSDSIYLDFRAANFLNDAVVQDISAGADGYFYMLIKQTSDNFSKRYIVVQLNNDGEIYDYLEIDAPNDEVFSKAYVSADHQVVLVGLNSITLCNWKGELINNFPIDIYFDISSNDTGLLFFCDDKIAFFDYQAMKLSTSNMPDYADNDSFIPFVGCQGLDSNIFVNDGLYFYQIGLGNENIERTIRWNYSFYDFSKIAVSCQLGEDSFASVILDEEFIYITGFEKEAYAERSIVNVALIGVRESALDEINGKSQLYEYKAITYRIDEIDRFIMDMASGNVPDLVLFINNLNTSSPLFEDLYPYIDSDPELSRESFLPHLLEGLSTNGELHQIWDKVQIYTLLARQRDVGEAKNLTTSDYDKLLEESEQYSAIFKSFMSRENLLNFVAGIGTNFFVDKENAVCYFDSPAFSDLLKWCNEMSGAKQEGQYIDDYSIDEVILFFEILSPERLEFIPEIYGEPMTVVGFPNGDIGFSCYYHASRAAAIPTGSQNKEGAWFYIRELLKMENQLEGTDWPVITDAVQRKAGTLPVESKILLDELFEKTCYTYNFTDDSLQEIIISCGQAYLQGGRTLEETISLIQAKASIYVSEQYG